MVPARNKGALPRAKGLPNRQKRMFAPSVYITVKRSRPMSVSLMGHQFLALGNSAGKAHRPD